MRSPPSSEKEAPEQWTGKILVPYCLESKLGGVQRLLDATEALWYRRSFQASPSTNQRTLLNFEAVDYRCEVFVNGKSVGTHQGGNTPFSFDITEAVRDGDNELIVRVEDETEAWQLRGKQCSTHAASGTRRSRGFGRRSGWNRFPASYIDDLKITTDAECGNDHGSPRSSREATVRVSVRCRRERWRPSTSLDAKALRTSSHLPIPDAKLWSPARRTCTISK